MRETHIARLWFWSFAMATVGQAPLVAQEREVICAPSEIGNVSESTRSLILVNCVQREIPTSLWRRTDLQSLVIIGEQGVQPATSVGRGVTVLPDQVGQLTSLTNLVVFSCPIEHLPRGIAGLTNLQHLRIDSTRLLSLPAEIGSLRQLRVLSLWRNLRLTSLPPEIGRLSNLRLLQVWKCPLRQLPTEIGQLTQMTELKVQTAALEAIPDELGRLQNLIGLDLSANRLQTLPEALHNMVSLRWLDLEGNPALTGERIRRIRMALPGCEVVWSESAPPRSID